MPNGHTYLCRRKAAKARFDNRQNRPAHQPLPSHRISGSGAGGTSSPPNRQCYPPHFMRECIPPNLHDPQRAKGSLDRRSKRLSFPHFFLRRKKCGRRRLAPAGVKLSPSETNNALAAGARNSPFRHTKNSPPATAEGLFFTDDIPACTPHSTARRNWTSWPGHCSDTHGCRRSRTPAR